MVDAVPAGDVAFAGCTVIRLHLGVDWTGYVTMGVCLSSPFYFQTRPPLPHLPRPRPVFDRSIMGVAVLRNTSVPLVNYD